MILHKEGHKWQYNIAIILVLLIVIAFMLNMTKTKLQAYGIHPANNNASKDTAENISKPLISDTLQGAIVGGIIGIGSGIVVSQIQYYIAQPRISIKEETTEVVIVQTHFMDAMGYSESQSPYRETPNAHIATRIAVKNSGRTAAENCKAFLIIKNLEVRVAWMIPKEDFTYN